MSEENKYEGLPLRYLDEKTGKIMIRMRKGINPQWNTLPHEQSIIDTFWKERTRKGFAEPTQEEKDKFRDFVTGFSRTTILSSCDKE